ncbi:TetR/AcrR family transcriptional regulator [Paenibacillus pinistramenti]|uniref:TetR/AcrR family transcriptional regulator n=1 Tax=Paenibacillus pinistramenti TaxID=1768003 RepID=UPI0011097745|nr:TetR/AcrR family transcriptional regulator [Paenibacillus pinistramenti]
MTERAVFHDFVEMINTMEMPNGKRKIMIAALELFSEQGFDGTSTAQIAERSGMSEATLFKYYNAKKALLLAIISPIISSLIPTWGGEFQRKLKQCDNDLRSLIHFIVEDRWAFLSANAPAITVLLNELMTSKEVLSLFKSTVDQHLSVNGSDILKVFQNTNELDVEQDFKSICRLFIGQLLIFFLEKVRFNIRADVTQESEDLEIIKNHIYKALRKND